MRGVIRAISIAAVLLPVAAQAAPAMTVNDFLAKVKALQAQGVLAMTSPDLAMVRDEVKGDAAAYRAQIEADKAAGKPARACPPPVGTAKIDAPTLLTEFGAIPPARRGMSLKTALYAMMDRRYPCR